MTRGVKRRASHSQFKDFLSVRMTRLNCLMLRCLQKDPSLPKQNILLGGTWVNQNQRYVHLLCIITHLSYIMYRDTCASYVLLHIYHISCTEIRAHLMSYYTSDTLYRYTCTFNVLLHIRYEQRYMHILCLTDIRATPILLHIYKILCTEIRVASVLLNIYQIQCTYIRFNLVNFKIV